MRPAVDAVQGAINEGIPVDSIFEAILQDQIAPETRYRRIHIAGELLALIGAPTQLDALMLVDDPISRLFDVAAFDEAKGMYARLRGTQLKHSPHDRRSDDHKNWERGWLQMDAALKEEKSDD